VIRRKGRGGGRPRTASGTRRRPPLNHFRLPLKAFQSHQQRTPVRAILKQASKPRGTNEPGSSPCHYCFAFQSG